jgi:hypothetical protein
MVDLHWGGAWIDIGGEFIGHQAQEPGWFATLASDVGIPATDILRFGDSIKFDVWKKAGAGLSTSVSQRVSCAPRL